MAETKKTVVARLFAEHRGALQAFLYRRVRRRPEAAELAQEVYVRILRVPDIGAIRDPGAYLYTVAQGHDSPGVREAAQRALDELGQRAARGAAEPQGVSTEAKRSHIQ